MAQSNVIPFPRKDKNLSSLTNKELSDFYQEMLGIKEYFDEVEEEVISRLSSGYKLPKFELKVLRKGSRRWAKESVEERQNILKDNFYSKKPSSPAEVEKLVLDGVLSSEKYKILKKLITRSKNTVGVIPIKAKKETKTKLTSDIF